MERDSRRGASRKTGKPGVTGRKRDLFSLEQRSQDDEESEEVPEPPNKKRKLKDKIGNRKDKTVDLT